MASFTQKLFNLSFQEFITPSIIKVLYVLCIIGIVVYCIVMAVSGFTAGFGYGLLALLGAIIAGAIFVIFARVYLEVIVVFFRILGLLEKMAAAKGVETASAPAPAPGPITPPPLGPGEGI